MTRPALIARLNVRLSEEIKLRVEDAAGAAGLDLSDWARLAIHRDLGVEPDVRRPPMLPADVSDLAEQLRRIGINLNQVVHMGHLGRDVHGMALDLIGTIERLIVAIVPDDSR